MTTSLIANDVISYLEHVFSYPSISTKIRCYRGQADSSWQLKPSILRNLISNAENSIFSELMLEAPSEFIGDKLMLDKLVRAQHYGLPTRLLDVSLNPLVGLFFACEESEHQDKDGIVKILDFMQDRVKLADSDTISLISNLARLNDSEKEKIRTFLKRNDYKDKDVIKQFRELEEMRRLTQFVRIEKPYFLDIAQPLDLKKYYFVHPFKNNRRVVAQSGAFIVAGLLQFRSPEASRGIEIKNIKIPSDAKSKILKELDSLNINSRTMFPEVEFTSKYIKKKWIK